MSLRGTKQSTEKKTATRAELARSDGEGEDAMSGGTTPEGKFNFGTGTAKASKLLKITTTVQEQDSYKSTIKVKEFGERVKRTKVMQYYGFIAIIDGWKVKVIVKKIGNGEPFFWSIIPNWVTNKKRDLGKKYINFSGNLESD